MKLNADLILNAPNYLNTLGQRELLLRGHQIAVVENLGSTRDQFDSIDLCDNEIRVLGNLPKLPRLKTLLVSRNRISHLQTQHLAASVPNLENLVLNFNSVRDLGNLVASIAGMKRLQHLSITGNPVTDDPNYRLFIIWKCPQLRILDFQRIKDKERQRAQTLFGTWDQPTDLATQLLDSNALNTGMVGEAAGQREYSRLLTDEERQRLKEQLNNAKTMEEMERIEQQLKSGYVS